MKRIVLMLGLLSISAAAMAQDASPASATNAAPKSAHNRQGIVVGAGLGGGMQFLYYSTMNRTGYPIMADLKLGYGVTNKILVLFNPSIMHSTYDSLGFFTFQFPVAAQFYVVKDFYLRPGFGASYTTRSFDQFLRAQTVTAKITFGASLAAGYEFMLAHGKIGLSPELVYHYDRIPNGFNTVQSNTFGLQVSLLSYFKVK